MDPRICFKYLGAYVTQEDWLMGTLTVRETISFYAALRLSCDKHERETKVEEVLHLFGLDLIGDSRVGSAIMRGISGGEKKRTSIACEFVTDPGLIFLDEPTSGLDSYNAFRIVTKLKELTLSGCTVLTTIHQPGSKTYELFDNLMLLHRGSVVYFGAAREAVKYFDSLGFRCSSFYNPADFLIDIVLDPDSNLLLKSEEKSGQVQLRTNFSETYLLSASYKQNLTELEQVKKRATGSFMEDYRPGVFVQFLQLFWRNAVNVARDPRTTFAQLGQNIFISLLIGSLYFRIPLTQVGIGDRLGAIFFLITNIGFSGFGFLNLFLEERNILKRDRSSGLYGAFSYFIAKFLTELPPLILYTTVLGSIVYWMVGFNPLVDRFFIYLATVITEALLCSSLFVFIGAVSPNMQIAQILAPISLVLFMLFGGFFLNLSSIPVYWVWMKQISFFKYTYEILVKNELSGLEFQCTSPYNCIPNGDIQLDILGMKDVNIPINFAILLMQILLLRVVAFLVVLFFHKM
eukprot:TRINITY_DN2681_c0_g1_i9.p1 TRINITY_DN2681_c0_g1~~TRINITY_DN2681_c0_g1_i9.p1  ORF type:complete len:518 (-),score=101.00 TRINITY_DN2681_c0_g1_i9:59-1612(-)